MRTARVAPEKTVPPPVLPLCSFAVGKESQMKKLSYAEQLRHPMWQRKRLEVMQRDDFACQSCYGTEATLNVHHKRYVKGRMAWDYPADELVTLCQECHESKHSEKEFFDGFIALLPEEGPDALDSVMCLVGGWASARGVVDERLLESLGPFWFAFGELAGLMSLHFSYDCRDIKKLRDLLLSAGNEKRARAIEVFADALKVTDA